MLLAGETATDNNQVVCLPGIRRAGNWPEVTVAHRMSRVDHDMRISIGWCVAADAAWARPIRAEPCQR